MRTKKDLLLGEWAVLALLCEQPLHGYALAAAMSPEGELGRIWTISQPLVYRTIDVLRGEGLIEVAARRPGDRAPRRTELRATANGRRRVSRWLATPERNVRSMRSSFLLKLAFLRRRDRSPLDLLEAQREILTEQVPRLRKAARGAPGEFPLVEQWRLSAAKSALAFVDSALAAERKSTSD